VSDREEILKLIIERADVRLDGQLRDNDALDAKALGLLAATGAALGVLVAVHESLNRYWWIPALLLGLAAAMLLIVIWPREFDIGPDWREFYTKHGDGKLEEVGRQMLSELVSAIEWNERIDKHSYLYSSYFLLFGGLLGAVVIALAS
jgi:hypothetical protein